jgi:CRP-like cAMP-binding protein
MYIVFQGSVKAVLLTEGGEEKFLCEFKEGEVFGGR